MNSFNCDLHFHGLYAGGVSKNMHIPIIAQEAPKKGLHVVTTGDITHPKWIEEVKENIVEDSNGVYKSKTFETHFVIGTELETVGRVHHVVLLPSIESAEQLRESLKGFGNLDSFGCARPKLRLSGQQVAEKVLDVGGILGPSHAFTPYFGVYAHHDSLQGLYGDELWKKIPFIELGLSADSYWADLIPQNHQYQFLTASDSHSPWPHRIGREFVRLNLKEPSFKEIRKALEDRSGERLTLNVGLNPREGKYHETACSSCYAHYDLAEAEKLKMRCPKCKGSIKRGVKERITQLAQGNLEEKHPKFRAPYLHLLPLAEIIQLSVKVRIPTHIKVQEKWNLFAKEFGNEINALVDVPVEELKRVDETIGHNIECFRKGLVFYEPGGGGDYGKPVLCESENQLEEVKTAFEQKVKANRATQKSLMEF